MVFKQGAFEVWFLNKTPLRCVFLKKMYKTRKVFFRELLANQKKNDGACCEFCLMFTKQGGIFQKPKQGGRFQKLGFVLSIFLFLQTYLPN